MRRNVNTALGGISALALVMLVLVSLGRRGPAPAQAQAPGMVSIKGNVVDPRQQPVLNPQITAHLIDQNRVVPAKVAGNAFEFTLAGRDQTDEIVIYCTALGTNTRVPHISGRKDTPGVVIVHRDFAQVTKLTHVNDQLQALRSAEIMVRSAPGIGEWHPSVRPIFEPSLRLIADLEQKLENMAEGPDDLRKQLLGTTRALKTRIGADKFKNLFR
jgi:hypothetical protein